MSDIHEGVTLGDGSPSKEPLVDRALEHLVEIVNRLVRREIGACVALAFPDRLSKRRGADGADWISAGGRGFRMDPASPLAREAWIAVAYDRTEKKEAFRQQAAIVNMQ